MLEIAPTLLALQILLASNVAQQSPAQIAVNVPVPVQSIAAALGLANPDPSTLLLRIIRHVYGAPEAQGRRLRDTLTNALAKDTTSDTSVRLPLPPQIWQEVILHRQVESGSLMSAILRDRAASLVYFGLSALDDETLRWLSSHTGTLVHLRKHPEVFAAFGRSLHIRDARVVLPGGPETAPWESIVGADPADPEVFIERLMVGNGRLALLYDTIEHLDGQHQQFALGLRLAPASRAGRLRALLDAFNLSAPDWRINERPFGRPLIDGAILLSTIRVKADGEIEGPSTRRLWDRVFRGDALNEVPFERVSDADLRVISGSLPLDSAWLADRILRVPYGIGRRRLNTLLFVQRVFNAGSDQESSAVATIARAYLSFPALMISLERTGVTSLDEYVRAAEHAARLSAIESPSLRRNAIAQFQAALALIERSHRARTLSNASATTLLSSLCALEVSSRTGYQARFTEWVRAQLLPAFPKRDSLEETLLAGIAGVHAGPTDTPVIEWEERRYRVDPAFAELRRLQQVRERQGGATLDATLAAIDSQRQLADTLTSIVYAIHLGDPDGAAVTSGNVALRHDFGLPSGTVRGFGDAWQLPIERFDSRTAWRVRGALLGLESALSRLSLRRIDRTDMPGEPTIGPQDRQTVMLTVALMDPFTLTDQARDGIASAISRGRDIVRALATDNSRLDDVVRAAGLSEWRWKALSWRLDQHADPLSDFSLPELYRIGASTASDRADEWGAATLPLTGCLCLTMPAASPWEDRAGYSSAVLATQAADIPLRLAEALSSAKLPALLAPALAGFVTQDVIDHAELGYPDDWGQFGRAVLEIPPAHIADDVAALAVAGPLIEIK